MSVWVITSGRADECMMGTSGEGKGSFDRPIASIVLSFDESMEQSLSALHDDSVHDRDTIVKNQQMKPDPSLSI